MAKIYDALPLLPADGDTTRVLRIEPSVSFDDPICCTLKVMPLQGAPAYSAVSYVWGDPAITRTIHVNGVPITVRLNIWNVLLQMRSNGNTGLLWIDAICINQEDIHERGRQVSIMGRIYSNAVLVFVWLGTGDPSTEQLIRELNEFDWPTPLEDDSGYFEYLGWKRSKTLEVDIHERLYRPSMLDYWSRTWIVQEFLLAKKLSYPLRLPNPATLCGRRKSAPRAQMALRISF